jgi:hypothetical protein
MKLADFQRDTWVAYCDLMKDKKETSVSLSTLTALKSGASPPTWMEPGRLTRLGDQHENVPIVSVTKVLSLVGGDISTGFFPVFHP